MALINGALHIGRSALAAAQAGLAVTGNNMANAATPSYSRQAIHLAPTQYTEVIPGKYTGTGVAVSAIRRQVDDALNGRIRSAMSDSSSNYVLQQGMARVEAVFNELTEHDLSTHLNTFFSAWSALQNQPQDMASRSVVRQEGQTLAAFVRSLNSELTSIQTDLDAQVRFQMTQTNSLLQRVADINAQIVGAEAGLSGSSAALRDERDDLLNQLSELVEFSTREVAGGAVNLFIGNDPVIQHAQLRTLVYNIETDANGNTDAQVVFADNQQAISLTGGKISGLMTTRDDQLGTILSDLDTWTSTLIYEVNKLHTLGAGLNGFTTVTSSLAVDDATASLADTTNLTGTGLPWAVNNGAFVIDVTDAAGVTTGYMINVNVDPNNMSLNDLRDQINAQLPAQVTATIDASNRLRIDASSGFTFGFSAPSDTASDAADVLAVLGINTFFQGSSASDIDIRSDLTADGVAASASGLPGDGDIARRIAERASAGITALGGATLSENFTAFIGNIAADTRVAQDNYIAADVVVQTLQAERQGISGVSIDEEAIHMITFQRAFQGAARYINMVDQMLEEIIALAS